MRGSTWVRPLGFALFGATCAIAGALLVGTALGEEPGVTRASRLVIVDDKGTRRIALGEVDIGTSAGAYGLSIHPDKGPGRIVVGMRSDGEQTFFMTNPSNGAPLVSISVTSSGVVLATVTDHQNRSSVRLRAEPSGVAHLSMLKADGQVAEEMASRRD